MYLLSLLNGTKSGKYEFPDELLALLMFYQLTEAGNGLGKKK